MNNNPSNSVFEDAVSKSFGVPAIRAEFVNQVYGEIMQRASSKNYKSRSIFRLRPAWSVALIILVLIMLATLAVGPQRVIAAIGRLFGYIPGVGIVDDSAPIRVLAEPVSVTRDGISITVTSATLTGDRTHIDYRIFGIPGSAYPEREDVAGCMQREYLRLADGTQLTQTNYGYEPVPANINEAVFVIPCIGNTLPGKVPENWELPLKFVPAPPDLTVMPVIELSPSPQASLAPGALSSGTPAAFTNSSVTVKKVIETSDGYILIGQFQPQSKPGESFQQTGVLVIRDAGGKKVSYTYPLDLNDEVNRDSAGMPGVVWMAQFKAAGVTFPLTIEIPGKVITPADPNITAEIDFDAGPNPQAGQEWVLNQQIDLAGHTLKLVSITADSRNGYGFRFEADKDIASLGVQIDGYTPIGGGGGGDNQGMINQSISYADLPAGNLKIILSRLMLASETQILKGQWSPSKIRVDFPANPTVQPGMCLTPNSLEQLNPIPEGLKTGIALIYGQLDNSEQWGLVLYNFDGSVKEIFAAGAIRGSLSPDGSQMAYPAEDGIHIVDLASKTENVLSGINGFDLHWSPDGKQIAFIGMGDDIINSVFVINTDGKQLRQVSSWSYETIIGWSPNGLLFFAAPYTGGAAWKVYSFDQTSGAILEHFTIENGTPKYLNPKLSPDGKWIAYRGRDNSSLYLVHSDGSDMHLVLDNVGAVGIAWSRTGWLGISLSKADSVKSMVILINPINCEVYRLPEDLEGELQGLFIP